MTDDRGQTTEVGREGDRGRGTEREISDYSMDGW